MVDREDLVFCTAMLIIALSDGESRVLGVVLALGSLVVTAVRAWLIRRRR